MGMKVTNYHAVKHMFSLMEKDVPAKARKVFKQYSQKIEKTAKEFSPVDEYRLEPAIHLTKFLETRNTIKVTLVANGRIRGRNVSTYAAIVHEYPWSKRGPRTRAKGRRAGPRYLTRAIKEHRAEMIKALHDAVHESVSASVRKSGVNATKRGKRR